LLGQAPSGCQSLREMNGACEETCGVSPCAQLVAILARSVATLETDVLVARDAAMRGFTTVLVERSDLATGTTGRFHGLLHSGGRYAVKDPIAARECV